MYKRLNCFFFLSLSFFNRPHGVEVDGEDRSVRNKSNKATNQPRPYTIADTREELYDKTYIL